MVLLGYPLAVNAPSRCCSSPMSDDMLHISSFSLEAYNGTYVTWLLVQSKMYIAVCVGRLPVDCCMKGCLSFHFSAP